MSQAPQHIDWEKLTDLLEKTGKEQQDLIATLSEEEKAALAWMQQLQQDTAFTGALNLNTGEAWQKTMERAAVVPAEPIRMLHYRKRWVAAAAVIILGGFTWLFWQNRQHAQIVENKKEPSIREVLAAHAPASKVQLITAEGNTIEVDSLRKFMEQDGTSILSEGGTMSYSEGKTPAADGADVLMNTLIVPRGYIQSVVLSDGTRVWLNAGSKLVFPVRFGKEQRKVTIEGEAYFEVRQQSNRPFIVSVNTPAFSGKQRNAEIKVLGTSFNVKAYDMQLATTLVQGSILFVPSSGKAVQLVPNQQTLYNQQTGLSKTATVNTEDFIAWKNDDLVMNSMKLSELALILERRYDVEISFSEAQLQNIQYNAALHFTSNVMDMLENLEQTGNVRFAVKDKKIMILPYEK